MKRAHTAMGLTVHYDPNVLRNPVGLGWLPSTRLSSLLCVFLLPFPYLIIINFYRHCFFLVDSGECSHFKIVMTYVKILFYRLWQPAVWVIAALCGKTKEGSAYSVTRQQAHDDLISLALYSFSLASWNPVPISQTPIQPNDSTVSDGLLTKCHDSLSFGLAEIF